MAKITVRGAGQDGKVVMWERHPKHPDGEAFISNDNIMRTIEETALVKRLLSEGRLTEDAPVKRNEVQDGEQIGDPGIASTGTNQVGNQDSEKRTKTPPR